jgi:hypothetical protein
MSSTTTRRGSLLMRYRTRCWPRRALNCPTNGPNSGLPASWRSWAAPASAPWCVLWEVGVQVKAAASVRRQQIVYPPTTRE